MKPRPWWCPDIREVLAVVVVLGAGYMIYHDADLENAGVMVISWVLGYYFGSSKGSQEKSALLTKARVEVEEHKCCRD